MTKTESQRGQVCPHCLPASRILPVRVTCPPALGSLQPLVSTAVDAEILAGPPASQCETGGHQSHPHVGASFVHAAPVGEGGRGGGDLQGLVPRACWRPLTLSCDFNEGTAGRGRPNGTQCHSPSRPSVSSPFIVPCSLMGPRWGQPSVGFCNK